MELHAYLHRPRIEQTSSSELDLNFVAFMSSFAFVFCLTTPMIGGLLFAKLSREEKISNPSRATLRYTTPDACTYASLSIIAVFILSTMLGLYQASLEAGKQLSRIAATSRPVPPAARAILGPSRNFVVGMIALAFVFCWVLPIIAGIIIGRREMGRMNQAARIRSILETPSSRS